MSEEMRLVVSGFLLGVGTALVAFALWLDWIGPR